MLSNFKTKDIRSIASSLRFRTVLAFEPDGRPVGTLLRFLIWSIMSSDAYGLFGVCGFGLSAVCFGSGAFCRL